MKSFPVQKLYDAARAILDAWQAVGDDEQVPEAINQNDLWEELEGALALLDREDASLTYRIDMTVEQRASLLRVETCLRRNLISRSSGAGPRTILEPAREDVETLHMMLLATPDPKATP